MFISILHWTGVMQHDHYNDRLVFECLFVVFFLFFFFVFLFFLKEQKFNLSPTLALNYTKGTRSWVVLVSNLSFLNLDFTYGM